jgi:predicted transcriptional regulator
MIIELKPAQQKVLDRAVRSGMSPEEVLDQAFAVLQEQYRHEDWMQADREAIAAQIEEGFAQAQHGELVDAEEAIQILQERRKNDNSPEKCPLPSSSPNERSMILTTFGITLQQTMSMRQIALN